VVLEARRERSQGTARRGGETEDRLLAAAGARVTEARERAQEREELRVELAPSGLPAGKEVLRAEGVAWRPPGADRPLLEDVTLRLRGPERVAVTGPNGCGKSSLLRILGGRVTPDRGRVVVGVPPERVAWLDQTAALLDRGRSVLQAVRGSHPDMGPQEARHVLARFLFAGDAAAAPVETLSGGERMRAALACVLGGRRAPALLLLDEPTNHLDLDARETVEEVVAGFDGALVVVSHDPAFLEGVGVERIVALGPESG
jgi:ATPase subunit of ABC transporter with duplicated ATPase domains